MHRMMKAAFRSEDSNNSSGVRGFIMKFSDSDPSVNMFYTIFLYRYILRSSMIICSSSNLERSVCCSRLKLLVFSEICQGRGWTLGVDSKVRALF